MTVTTWPTQTALRRAPDVGLPLRFMVAGLVGFVLLSAFVAWHATDLATGGLQTREMLVATHLFTLAWATMIVIGALIQLLPVVLEVPLHSEPFGYVTFWLLAPGVGILISGFWFGDTLLLVIGGTLVVAAMHFFLWNARRTLRAPGARPSVTASFLRASLTFFGLTLTWGFTLALNYRYRFFGQAGFEQLAAHASLGLLGWFTLTAIGVTYRLIPMFAVAHGYSERPCRPLLWTLGLGFGGLALSNALVAPTWVRNGFLWVSGLGLLAYVAHAAHMMSHRHRRQLELSMRFAAAAWAFLALTATLALLWNVGLLPRAVEAIAPGRFEPRQMAVGLGYLGAMGWISLLIAGMMYKIVPFLVWYALYREQVGRKKVPLLKDLWSERGGRFAFALLVPGIALTSAGLALTLPLLAQVGAWLAFAGALTFAATIAQVMAHRSAAKETANDAGRQPVGGPRTGDNHA